MILQAIRKRRSVRDFQSEAVPEEHIYTLIKAAQFAPTAVNNRSVEFMVIRDRKTKASLFEVVGQSFVQEAPVIIVPVVDKAKSVVPVQDLSVAIATMFYQAAAMGLGTVWKNLRDEWVRPVKTLLGIPDSYVVIALIPVGYAQSEQGEHTDEEFSAKKIHWDKW